MSGYLTIRILTVLLVLGTATGCAERRVDDLNKRLTAYWEGVRWRAPGAVAVYIEQQHRDRALAELTRKLDKMRVVDYTIVNLMVAPDQQSATALVSYSFYYLDHNDLRSGQEVQQWRYQKAGGWQLTTPAYEKKTPGVPATTPPSNP